MFFYAIFAVGLLCSRRVAVAGISLLFIALAAATRLAGPFPNPLGFWADPIILEFVFGMWIALALREGVCLAPWLARGLVLTGVAAGAGSFVWGLHALPRLIEWGVPAGLVVAGLVLSPTPQSTALGWRMLGFLGEASYSLYLVHPIALTLPRRSFPQLVDPVAHPWLYTLLLMAVAVGAAIVVHVAFEKPVTRWLQKRIAAMPRKPRAAKPGWASGSGVAP